MFFFVFVWNSFCKVSITWSQKNPDARTSSLASVEHVSCEWHFSCFLILPSLFYSPKHILICVMKQKIIFCASKVRRVFYFSIILTCVFCPRLSLGSEYGISWMIFLLQVASTVVSWRCSADGHPGQDSPRWLMPSISVGLGARLVQRGAFPLFLGLFYKFFYGDSGLHEWLFQEVLDVSCKTSYNLDLEIQGCYF